VVNKVHQRNCDAGDHVDINGGVGSCRGMVFFFFSSRRRHTRWPRDWSSDVCSSDLGFRFRDQQAWIDAAGVAAATALTDDAVAEIGRASCRERVESSGVAASLKTK